MQCIVCQKKVKLTTPTCKCNQPLCSIHLFYTNHNCPFDYKKEHQKYIEENNPKVYDKQVKVC